MSFRHTLRLLPLAGGLLLESLALPATAQSIDPAVVGERLQRLNATVESLELTTASQRRQIEALGNELHRVREETSRELNSRGSQRPWADDIKRHNDDLKRLADAIAEVDRKRIADHEQVLKILGDLKKSIASLAETPPTRPSTPRAQSGGRDSRANSGRSRPERTETPDPADTTPAPKVIPYTIGKGETLGTILEAFNADAAKKGYQSVSLQQVMKFNKISNPNRVREGMVLNLPLYPKSDKP